MSEEKILIAISAKSIHRATDSRFMAATLCGRSTTGGMSFDNFETAMFSNHSIAPFQALHDYGFTVVEVPADWSYNYQQHWQETAIRQAIQQVELFQNHYHRQDSRGGYDLELAEEVLALINKSYPQSISLLCLKHDLYKEPSDKTLSAVLAALVGDGFVDGTVHRTSKLNPYESVSLTKDGRRHIQDGMKRKTAKSKPAFHIDDASAFVLKQLLAEFRERKLTSDDLRNTYQGLSPEELKQSCIAEGISEVDYDLAMSDLDSHDLVKTGPQELYQNDPRSPVTIISFYSKNEYSYLTENGYREAGKLLASMPAKSLRPFGQPQSVIHGDQIINYGHAASIGRHAVGTINRRQPWGAIENQVDLSEVVKELQTLKAELMKTANTPADYQQLSLVAEAEEYAANQDGSKVMEVLSKSGKWLFDFATEVGTHIAAKVIAKSTGLEP